MDNQTKKIPWENLMVIIVIIVAIFYWMISSVVSCFIPKKTSNTTTTTNNSTSIGASVKLNGIFAATSKTAYQKMNDFVLSEPSHEELVQGYTMLQMQGDVVYLEEGTYGTIVAYSLSSGTSVSIKSGIHTGKTVWVFSFDID